MNTKNLIVLILFFIIIDITGLNNLWGENFHRRTLHHCQRSQYNPSKKPWIKFLNNKLDNKIINFITSININKKNCLQTVNPTLSKLFGGNYSTKCTLYYNDFDKNTQKQLDKIGESMIPHFEKLAGKKLYLGESNFRCVLLRYEGKDSQFTSHYDTEPNNCFRTLFLVKKEGEIPPFIYYDENNKKNEVTFNVGDGIFFKGTRTFHGVGVSKDPNMKRYMIGWQYSTDNSVKELSLCSKLRDASISKSIIDLSPHIISILILSLLFWYYIRDPFTKKQIRYLLLITILVSITAYLLPNKLYNTNIGTGLSSSLICMFVILMVSILTFGNIFYALVFYNYLLLTDMLLPRSLVGRQLKLVE